MLTQTLTTPPMFTNSPLKHTSPSLKAHTIAVNNSHRPDFPPIAGRLSPVHTDVLSQTGRTFDSFTFLCLWMELHWRRRPGKSVKFGPARLSLTREYSQLFGPIAIKLVFCACDSILIAPQPACRLVLAIALKRTACCLLIMDSTRPESGIAGPLNESYHRYLLLILDQMKYTRVYR